MITSKMEVSIKMKYVATGGKKTGTLLRERGGCTKAMCFLPFA